MALENPQMMDDGVYDGTFVKLDSWQQMHLNIPDHGFFKCRVMNPDRLDFTPGQAVRIHILDNEVIRVETD